MKKIINFFKRMENNYTKFFKQYIITNIILIISSIILCIFIDDTDLLLKYILFFVVNTFTIENFVKNKKTKLFVSIFSFIISFACGYLLNKYPDVLQDTVAFYFITAVCINLYHIVVLSKMKLSKYLYHVFHNILTVTIINGILNICVFGIITIVFFLLFQGNDYNLYLRSEFIICGFYTIPAYIYSFINMDNKVSELTNNILKYLILIVTLVTFVIVYIYLFKVIITNVMPVNEIFIVALLLFIVSLPVSIMYEELNINNKTLNVIMNNMSLSFIPLFFLQLYSVIARIVIYGFTENRYFGIVLLLAEAIVIFLTLYKNKKYLLYILFVIPVLALITFVIPYTNYSDFSAYSQVYRINKVMKGKETFKELNSHDAEIFAGAYNYLELKGKQHLVKYNLDEDDLLKIHSNSYLLEKHFVYVSAINKLDLFNYTSMESISEYDLELNGYNIILKGYRIDLSFLIEELQKDENYNDEVIIKLNDEFDLHLRYASFGILNDELMYCSIEGYIFKKA